MVLMSLPTFDKVSDLNEGLRFTEYFSFFFVGGGGGGGVSEFPSHMGV